MKIHIDPERVMSLCNTIIAGRADTTDRPAHRAMLDLADMRVVNYAASLSHYRDVVLPWAERGCPNEDEPAVERVAA